MSNSLDKQKNPPNKRGDKRVISQQVQHYEGPIPPADELRRYNDVLHNAAERILTMAESEATHRHCLEKKQLTNEQGVIDKTFRERARGQWFGLFIGVFTIAAGVYAAVNGAQWPGGFIGTGGVVGLVTVFVLGRRKN